MKTSETHDFRILRADHKACRLDRVMRRVDNMPVCTYPRSLPGRFMSRKNLVSLSVLLTLVCALAAFSQDEPKKVTAEVTVYANDPVYKELRSLSSATDVFSGDYATVNNLALKKDAGVFLLKSGEVYFAKAVQGRTVGAVFIGSGEFQLTPPTEIEKKSLAIFTDSPDIKESFSGLTIFFTDDTMAAIQSSPNATMGKNGPQIEKARSIWKDKEDVLRKTFRYNMTSRTLSDIYAPARK